MQALSARALFGQPRCVIAKNAIEQSGHRVKVSRANRSDIDGLANFCRDVAYPELRWQHVPFDIDALKETLALIIDSGSGACFVLKVENQIAGFALVFLNRYFFSREKYASDLTFYVSPDGRKGWAGVKLIRAMILYAKEQDVRELLLTVNSGVKVERTVRLIERMGGKVLGRSMSISL